MIACRREYRLQVNGYEDSYFIAKLLYRNSEVGRLQVLCAFDKLVIGDIIHNDIIHTPLHLGEAPWGWVVKPKPIGYRCIGLGTNTKSGLLTPFMMARKKYSLVLFKKSQLWVKVEGKLSLSSINNIAPGQLVNK